MISNLAATISRTQDIANTVSKIKESGISAASKRKEFAAAKLRELQERLRIMLLFVNVGGTGDAKGAAQLARELAVAVREYAGAGNGAQEANGVAVATSASENQSSKFLSDAKQLATQIKSFIAGEVQKARRRHVHEEPHEKEINAMNSAIDDASQSLGQGSTVTPAISIAGFSVSA